MSVKPPPRWTPRSLTAMLLPHLFRKARNPAESTGPFKERVPLDADKNHEFIKRKEMKMVKAIRADFRLTFDRPRDVRKNYLWSVVTGEWVFEHSLKLHYIFPFSLGPLVAREVFGRDLLRTSGNGMLIPPAVGQALNDVSDASEAESSKCFRQPLGNNPSGGCPDRYLWILFFFGLSLWRRYTDRYFRQWALTITPHKSIPKYYLFTRIGSETKSPRGPVRPESRLSVKDLDGQPVYFRNQTMPNFRCCYFHSCCAVWKSTFLEQPDRRAEDFWEQFQLRMYELWGTPGQLQGVLDIFKPPELVKSEEMEKIKERDAEAKDTVSSTDVEPAVEQTDIEEQAMDKQSEPST